MEAVASVGEALLTVVFEALRDKFNASDLKNFAQKKKIYAELKKLEKKLQSIKAVLTDAEEKQMADRTVKIWQIELRDLAYDVEDLLDEFAYKAGRRKLTAQPRSRTRRVTNFFPYSLRRLKSGVKMGSEIKKIATRLQEIAAQKNDLALRENVGGPANKRSPTTCLLNKVNVFGRGKDAEAMVDLLLVETTSVIPIVGMGGIGKTTLAQLAYNDDKVQGFFDSQAWIYVSEDFNVINVTKAILKAVINPGVCDIDDLNLLHVKLKEELSGRRILLVLDDVWHENDVDWERLILPFQGGKSGSKIIITTRNQSVAQIAGTVPAYHLKELPDHDCLSVLAQHAFGSPSFDMHPQLKAIGEDIVRKCKGLPLAVKTLASLLKRVAYQEWEDVSRRNMCDLTEETGGIFSALRPSYRHLPSHLKPCFAYCSLFPKDYKFDRDELVLLWIAEGFLPQKGDMQPQDLGRKYFSELLSRSFFQQSNNNKSLFVMHDLLIDLAQSVSGDLYLNMEHGLEFDDGRHSFENARHVSFIRHQYDVSQRFEILSTLTCLRSVLALPISYQGKYCYLSSKVLHKLLSKQKRLRVLSLSGYFIGDLSKSIGDLKHLRYLNLSKTAVRVLPESVSNLHHLEILLLNQCHELTGLPVGTSRLIKLQYLDNRDTPKLQEMPSGLGNLTSLRVLPKFIIGKAGGPTLRDLKDLSLLQGQLSILRLQNVVDVQDARVANLKQKHNLKELALEWSNDLNLSTKGLNHMQVLGSLHPPKDLQRLSISCYGAGKFPSWVGDPSFAKIEHLNISDCVNCTSLPSLGQLPLLRKLNIKGMHAVTSLGPEFYGEGSPLVMAFPSLGFLRFENMTEWKIWNSAVGNVEVFPLLRELILHNCPSLNGIPRALCSLVKLDVQMCPWSTNSPLSFPCLGELNVADSSDVILKSMVDHSSITKLKLDRISSLAYLTEELTKALVKLEVLEIEGCSELTCLWLSGSESENLPLLESLVIKNCPKLVSLIGEKQGLCHFSSLKNLRIESCQIFVSFPAMGLPYTLECLTIHDCEALESLCDTFRMRDSNNPYCLLEELDIARCPSLKSFPNGKLPLTLKRLSIVNCSNLQFLPDDNKNSASHLESLCIEDCHLALESFLESGLSIPNLKILSISNCWNLRSLPYHMPPNITSLELRNCANLKQQMSEWGLDKHNCLKEIKIAGTCPAADMVSFPDNDGIMLPSTLTYLCMESLQNLESLSKGLQNLIALEQLHIKDCHKLQYLPETGLPASLGRLSISGSLLLQQKCKRERGKYWPIISNIPCLEID